jgi:hypothetical protein
MIQNFNLKVYKNVTKTSVIGPTVITETFKEIIKENMENEQNTTGSIYKFP